MGVGSNGSALAFSIGNLILGIMVFPFIINLAQQLWIPVQNTDKIPRAHLLNRLNFVGLIIAIICIPGIIVVAFYSMAPETIVPHAIGAMMFFFGTILYGSAFTIIIELRKKSTFGLRISSCCVILFFLGFIAAGAALVIMYPEEFQIFMASPMSYIVRILGDSVDTKLATIRVFEWLFVLAMNVWCVNLSLFSIKFEHFEQLEQLEQFEQIEHQEKKSSN
jgi:hypothetical protein